MKESGLRERDPPEKREDFGGDKLSGPESGSSPSPDSAPSASAVPLHGQNRAGQGDPWEGPTRALPAPSETQTAVPGPPCGDSDDDFYQKVSLDDLFAETDAPAADRELGADGLASEDFGDQAADDLDEVILEPPPGTDLVLDGTLRGAQTLAPPDPDALPQWVALYYKLLVEGAPARTEEAKRRDLLLFVNFFDREVGHDRVDGWTPAVTRHFQNGLRRTVSVRTGRVYKATTVNRVLATVRHFGRWLVKKRPLLAGNPMEGVKDLVVEAPAWNGLTGKQVMRLKAAAEQRLASSRRKNQNPLLEAAVLSVLLHTGLREHELCGLDLEQYDGKCLRDVVRKAKRVTAKVRVPSEPRALLERYLGEVRGRDPGPLFLSRLGERFQPKAVYRICARLARQANAHLPQSEQMHLSPHMLRHTFLKRVADKHGVHVAQELSGNTSIREIFRYAKPSEEEMDRTTEELFA